MFDCVEGCHCFLDRITRYDELVNVCVTFAGKDLPPDIERLKGSRAIFVESL